MGLEAVELVTEVEATFSVMFDDRRAGPRWVTVGDLHRDLLGRLAVDPPDEPACLSATVFYRLRRALGETLGVDRSRVRPDVAVESLLPRASRPRDWRRLEAATGLTLPGLERPDWVYSVVVPSWVLGILSTVGLVADLLVYQEQQIFTRTELTSAAVLGFAVAIGVELATRPLERLLPRGCETVRGLVEATVSRNFARLRAERRGWTRGDVWATLRGLVAGQAGVDPETITEATAFADLWG